MPVCAVIVSTSPMSARRGGATGNAAYTGTEISHVASTVLRSRRYERREPRYSHASAAGTTTSCAAR